MSETITIEQLVAGCQERGISLWVEYDPFADETEKRLTLRVSAVPGMLTEGIVEALRANEEAIGEYILTVEEMYRGGKVPTYNRPSFPEMRFFEDAELLAGVWKSWMDQEWCYSTIGGETVVITLKGEPTGYTQYAPTLPLYALCASYPVEEIEALKRQGITEDGAKLQAYHRYRSCLLSRFDKNTLYVREGHGALSWDWVLNMAYESSGQSFDTATLPARMERVLAILTDAGFVEEGEKEIPSGSGKLVKTIKWRRKEAFSSTERKVATEGGEDFENPFEAIPEATSKPPVEEKPKRRGTPTMSKTPKGQEVVNRELE